MADTGYARVSTKDQDLYGGARHGPGRPGVARSWSAVYLPTDGCIRALA